LLPSTIDILEPVYKFTCQFIAEKGFFRQTTRISAILLTQKGIFRQFA